MKSSFGDFLKAPTTPLNNKTRAASAPWSSPAAPAKSPGRATYVPSTQEPCSVSFQAIQKQEADFKDVQDHSYKDNGKWFIERRERAGSLTAIQETATPLAGLGRYLKFGLPGAISLGIGFFFLALAALRGLQEIEVFNGGADGRGWGVIAPYAIVFTVAVAIVAFLASRITKGLSS